MRIHDREFPSGIIASRAESVPCSAFCSNGIHAELAYGVVGMSAAEVGRTWQSNKAEVARVIEVHPAPEAPPEPDSRYMNMAGSRVDSGLVMAGPVNAWLILWRWKDEEVTVQ